MNSLGFITVSSSRSSSRSPPVIFTVPSACKGPYVKSMYSETAINRAGSKNTFLVQVDENAQVGGGTPRKILT